MNDFLNETEEPLDDDEFPSDDDLIDDDDGDEFVTCNHCGASVYELAEQCPQCGMYVISSSNIWQGRPAWWVILGLVGLVAAMFVLAFRFF